MPGASARKRHDRKRKKRVEHCYRDSDGIWHPKVGFTRKGAQRAVERLYEMTLYQYVKYECRICRKWHLRPHGSQWRASLLVHVIEEGSG